jgi:hypothetical protein
MNKVLSDGEVLKIAGDHYPVHAYNDLFKFHELGQALGGKNACIFLYEVEKNNGHWVCLILHPERKTLEFFDPYGLKPDAQKSFIPAAFWLDNLLSKWLYNSARKGYRVEYNEKKLQRFTQDVNTCGRWVGVRIRCQKIPLTEFQEVFRRVPDKDALITEISNSFLQ